MKIAVPVTHDHQIDDHFGHCEFYNVYTVDSKLEITNITTLKSPQGCGCKSNIAQVLSNEGVDTMLAGGIGAGAINVLMSWGINVVRGCSGDAKQVVTDYIHGKVSDSGSSCAHHEHHHAGEGHSCSH